MVANETFTITKIVTAVISLKLFSRKNTASCLNSFEKIKP